MFQFDKRPSGTLVKQIKLSQKELFYRLASEEAAYDRAKIPLKAYYDAAAILRDRQSKALIFYATALLALFFYHLGQLDEFSLLGLSLSEAVLGHGLLAFAAVATFQYALATAKIQRYQSLFQHIYDTSSGAKQQDLLLRFPSMFTSMFYFSRMSGRPAHMLPDRPYSIRLIILLLLLFITGLAWIFSVSYLAVAVSLDLWDQGLFATKIWSKVWILGCWGLVGASLLLPTMSLSKIKFHHFGLVTLLARAQIRDHHRYDKYIQMINNSPLGQRALRDRATKNEE